MSSLYLPHTVLYCWMSLCKCIFICAKNKCSMTCSIFMENMTWLWRAVHSRCCILFGVENSHTGCLGRYRLLWVHQAWTLSKLLLLRQWWCPRPPTDHHGISENENGVQLVGRCSSTETSVSGCIKLISWKKRHFKKYPCHQWASF